MGLKGDPGESISIPEAMVSPDIQTVSENQTATFYCSSQWQSEAHGHLDQSEWIAHWESQKSWRKA